MVDNGPRLQGAFGRMWYEPDLAPVSLSIVNNAVPLFRSTIVISKPPTLHQMVDSHDARRWQSRHSRRKSCAVSRAGPSQSIEYRQRPEAARHGDIYHGRAGLCAQIVRGFGCYRIGACGNIIPGIVVRATR